MRKSTAAAALAAFLAGACSEPAPPEPAGSMSAAEECAGDGIIASNAWIRATRPGRDVTAAYVRLCNGGDLADRLVGADFDGAQAVEIHISSVDANGVARMRPVEGGLDLPAGAATALAPGGAHIMLIGLTSPLAAGGEATLTLRFETAAPMTFAIPVHEGHAGH